MNPEDNAAAWRLVIMHAEGTAKNRNPYGVMFGGGTFDNNGIHPNEVIDGGNGLKSAAAGAYQFMPFTWQTVTKQLGLPPNSPMTKENQDKAATHLAMQRGVDIRTAPFTRENVSKLAPEWASLPTLSGQSYYGQPVKAFQNLKAIFGKYKPATYVQKTNTKLKERYPEVYPEVEEPLVIPQLRKTEKKLNPLQILSKTLQHSLQILGNKR